LRIYIIYKKSGEWMGEWWCALVRTANIIDFSCFFCYIITSFTDLLQHAIGSKWAFHFVLSVYSMAERTKFNIDPSIVTQVRQDSTRVRYHRIFYECDGGLVAMANNGTGTYPVARFSVSSVSGMRGVGFDWCDPHVLGRVRLRGCEMRGVRLWDVGICRQQ